MDVVLLKLWKISLKVVNYKKNIRVVGLWVAHFYVDRCFCIFQILETIFIENETNGNCSD